jgi:hypothetical protein
VRNKLLAMALLPLLMAFPLLVLALAIWSNQAYDRLLITKVRSDLAVAQGYFDQVLIEVGSGTLGVADSRALADALRQRTPEARTQLSAHLAAERERLGLDFLVLYDASGQPIARGAPGGLSLEDQRAGYQPLPKALADTVQTQRERAKAKLLILDNAAMRAVVPHLSSRTGIALVPTRNAAPTQRQMEDRAMVAQATLPVLDAEGRRLGVLSGGLLLNQNLDFIDHINRIVYPAGSLAPRRCSWTTCASPPTCACSRTGGPSARGCRRRCATPCWAKVTRGSIWLSWSTTGTSRPTSRWPTRTDSASACSTWASPKHRFV